MNAIQFIKDHGVEKAREVVEGAPTFIRNALDQDETMYNPRTSSYIERGVQSALVQLDGEEYYRTTMPHDSAFYSECILLSDLKRLVESVDLIKSYGGIINAKMDIRYLDIDWDYDSPRRKRLEQAIADYEAIYSGAAQ